MLRQEEKLRCTKEPFIEDVGTRRIKSMRFSMFSGKEIRQSAEAQVWNNRIYEPNMKPAPNGLLDTRMGAANKQGECGTCHGSYTECPGHFGYLKLALPVFNIGFFNNILDVVKCICKGCSRVLLVEKDRREFLKKMRQPRAEPLVKFALMKKVRDKCKLSRCPWCGFINGVAKKGRMGLVIVHDCSKTLDGSTEELRSALSHKKEKLAITSIHTLDPATVLSLFRRMIDEDCELLNLGDRPEKLIITEIAVPPVPIRPSVFVGGGGGRMSNEDSITCILKNIVNTNSILKGTLQSGEPLAKCFDCWQHLQLQVVEYINSDAPCLIDSQHRGLIQRLKGKTGRFRGNLSGKRTEYTGRTVISPDPNLRITEVAIPILMARVLTYPERVSYYNIEKLRQCIRNGPHKHPGANFILQPDGTKLHLKYCDRRIAARDLKYGCIVERHLEDGDIVLFNRQPSLHRMSIMSHRARIMPWRTLRFNESVCNPYNADFDGDEMNLHVPQTEEARTEALMLMGVQNNLCTPKNGEILVASTQDFLTSSFLITRKDSFYDRSSFTLLCSYLGDAMENIDLPTPALIKPIELWTGKQLFSVLVRPNAFTKVYLNLGVREKICTKKCALTVEDKTSEAVHDAMCPNDGFVYFRNSELLSGQVGKKTLGNGNNEGMFSVLIRDYNSHAAASCMNRLAKFSARFIGNHGFSIGVDDVQPGESLNEKKGKTIGEGYQECHELIAQYSKGALKPQPGCSRAQTLEARISGVLNKLRDTAGDHCMSTLHWRNSPLIMSQCGSKGSPINISQMVVCVGQQSVGGRRAPNGFIDRTLPHFPINSKTPAAKGFVANSFYTGLTATEFFFHTMGGREGLVDTAVKTAETGYMSRRLMKGLEDLSVFYDQTVRNASGGIVQFVYGDDGMDPVKMEGKGGNPLNLDQLFMKVMATCPQRGHETLSPEAISQMLNDKLSEQDPSAGGCSDRFKELLTKFVGNRIKMLRNTRRALHLDEDHVGRKDSSIEECVAANISGIAAKQLQVFLDTCLSRYHSKIIEAGASIGAIGAQSIGEPGTQMTLKTFHFAGVASMNVTLGVPRIKEIINAAKKISTPIITAELLSGQDESFGVKVKRCIEKVVLGEVAAAIKIVLKSSQPNLVVKLDMQRIEAQGYEGINADSVQLSIINYPKLKLKSQHVRVIDEAKLRIYPDGTDRSKLQFELHNLKSMLPKVIVKGIPTVERAVVNPVKGRDKTIERYNLLVEGTNLLAVLGAPGVDAMKTKSNHIMEVNQTLGIEAARRSIIDEIQYTFESNNMIIDLRHMMLLADLMTYKGEVLGITRYGIAKMKSSVLMLASFEKTSEHLFNASYAGREDQIDGVSECIIMGIPMQLGTGILKVRQRLESLPEFKYQPAPIMSS
ncbi:DNA-directed RNA polymerase III subunit 1 [Aegilops tauschii subsp. strangulata]|uniref:DNA-directed RNA polymerase subunit n=9 Tax=Aegilops tauschii subsp. strangulata TaxID=200361 RepID=A0A453GGS3_AEGTS|nr:DNA-directed RNA polymerase III subunit 1 [Aegilops tauschii subsp. strangulata]